MSEFQALLQQINDEHMKQVTGLQEEVVKLRQLLSDRKDSCKADKCTQNLPQLLSHSQATHDHCKISAEQQEQDLCASTSSQTASTYRSDTVSYQQQVEEKPRVSHVSQFSPISTAWQSSSISVAWRRAWQSTLKLPQTVLEGTRSIFGQNQAPREGELVQSNSSRNVTVNLDFLHHQRATQQHVHVNKHNMSTAGLKLPKLLLNVLARWSELEEPTRVGCLASFESSTLFTSSCLCVILLSSFFGIYQVEYDMQKALHIDEAVAPVSTWQDLVITIEACFTLFLTFELLVKLSVHRFYFFLNNDWKWNILDFAVLSIAWASFHRSEGHSSHLSYIRLSKAAKSVRLLRALRLAGQFRHLNLMAECIVGALVSLFWCLVLLGIVILGFALVFVNAIVATIEAHPEEKEKVVGRLDGIMITMLRLFQAITGGEDWSMVYSDLSMAGPLAQTLLIFYIAFCVISLWNIVTAMHVERSLAFCLPDIEIALTQKARCIERDAVELTRLFMDGSAHADKLSYWDFLRKVRSPTIQQYLDAFNISLTDADLFFAMLHSSVPPEKVSEDENGDPCIDTKVVVNALLHLRGVASTCDLQAIHWDVRRLHAENAALHQEAHDILTKVSQLTLNGTSKVNSVHSSKENSVSVQDAVPVSL